MRVMLMDIFKRITYNLSDFRQVYANIRVCVREAVPFRDVWEAVPYGGNGG